MEETQTRGEATTSDSGDSSFGKRKVAASIENSKVSSSFLYFFPFDRLLRFDFVCFITTFCFRDLKQ